MFMKYLSIQQLKKHFEHATANNTKMFLVVISNDYEKESIIQYIVKHFSKKSFSISKFFKDTKISDVITTFQSPSLLGGDPLVILENLESFSLEELQTLNNFIKRYSVNLIASSSSKQASSVLYATIEKKGLVIDFTQEKIWEKEKRLANAIVEKCILEKKNISSVVIQALLEKIGLDLALIENELDKLIIYVGNRKSIELEDIEHVCPENLNYSVWQMAEEIVWGEINFEKVFIETSFFHQLVSAIRYQIQLGYKIASLLEKNKNQDLSVYFPKIYPRALDKKKQLVQRNGLYFYKKALQHIFEIDFLSKSMSLNHETLFELLKLKLLFLSSYEFNTFA